ncbi:MAG: type II toxin-antitoxin system VapB family antitoxin [Bradyrhizobium sp.]
MSLEIHVPNADALARELAAATGEDIDTAVVRAIEERLAHAARPMRRRRSKVFSTDSPNCPFSTSGLPMKSSATAPMACRTDGHRHIGHFRSDHRREPGSGVYRNAVAALEPSSAMARGRDTGRSSTS